MYIKRQINKKQDSEDKIIQEINTLLAKNNFTKRDILKINKHIETLYKDII